MRKGQNRWKLSGGKYFFTTLYIVCHSRGDCAGSQLEAGDVTGSLCGGALHCETKYAKYAARLHTVNVPKEPHPAIFYSLHILSLYTSVGCNFKNGLSLVYGQQSMPPLLSVDKAASGLACISQQLMQDVCAQSEEAANAKKFLLTAIAFLTSCP